MYACMYVCIYIHTKMFKRSCTDVDTMVVISCSAPAVFHYGLHCTLIYYKLTLAALIKMKSSPFVLNLKVWLIFSHYHPLYNYGLMVIYDFD